MVTYEAEALRERARNLDKLNGLRMVLVDLEPAADPKEARLELHFYNANQVAAVVAAIGTDRRKARATFPISGGTRLPAGSGPGRVQVTEVAADADPSVLLLTVAPIGDYSTYTLGIEFDLIDPLFSTIGFRFRPGCFTTECDPEWCEGPATEPAPAIDYLARDFDSFKHTLIAAMIDRVPGWRPTSEADLDETLIELLSASADELADLQDRVMSEAYLGTARKRVSLARHARLMDYHIHQGNQATTWLALKVGLGIDGRVRSGFTAWTGGPEAPPAERQVFTTTDPVRVSGLLDTIRLYSWSRTVRTLPEGATEADLLLTADSQGDANEVRDLIRSGAIRHLLVQEIRDPVTCRTVGFDRARRQVVTLVPAAAQSIHDPDPSQPANLNAGTWVVRVRWREPLERSFCFVAPCPDPIGGFVEDISVFCGNLVRASHGMPVELTFIPPDRDVDPFDPRSDRTRRYEPPADDGCADLDDPCRPGVGGGARGVVCRLPEEDGPLAYRSTPPGGEFPSCSTLDVAVIDPAGGRDDWTECPSLAHSEADDTNFVVETDELGRSLIRFGNGTNGRRLPAGATIECRYQVGRPLDGNVGSDAITSLDVDFDLLLAHATVWNPLDVSDGREPEPPAEIIRRVPEAYRARQLRAVTLSDYVKRAQEVEGVSRAAARYAWTGSWRTVKVTIDPGGTTTLDAGLRRRVFDHLDAVRLIGEDLELRPPRFIPLEIRVTVCVDPGFWVNDIRSELSEAFSDRVGRDGRTGFFHPDRWTFGQELHASQVAGRIQGIHGIDHVVNIRMKRLGASTTGTDAIVAVRPNEILQVRNDPDHLEGGTIGFEFQGGRA